MNNASCLKKQNKERSILEDEKKEKDAVVTKLKSQEKELKKEMAAKQKQSDKLSGSMLALIRRAKEAAVRESKKTGAADKTATVRNANSNNAANAGASPAPASRASFAKAAHPRTTIGFA